MTIFNFRTDLREVSDCDAELRTNNEFSAGKLLEEIKSMSEAAAGARFRTDSIFPAGPKLGSIYFREKIGHNFCFKNRSKILRWRIFM